MVHTQFNWYWCHVPTFAPYKVEGMFHPLILAHGGSAQTVKTASIVLQSLTPNAQSVFRVLAEHRLAHPDEEGKNYYYYIKLKNLSFFKLPFPNFSHTMKLFTQSRYIIFLVIRDAGERSLLNLPRALPSK